MPAEKEPWGTLRGIGLRGWLVIAVVCAIVGLVYNYWLKERLDGRADRPLEASPERVDERGEVGQ